MRKKYSRKPITRKYKSRPVKKSMKKKSKPVKKSMKKKSKSICKSRLSTKIRKNMKEYKATKIFSRAQAIAIAYSQVLKEYPRCKKSLARKIKN